MKAKPAVARNLERCDGTEPTHGNADLVLGGAVVEPLDVDILRRIGLAALTRRRASFDCDRISAQGRRRPLSAAATDDCSAKVTKA